MLANLEHRRVLLVADDADKTSLRQLFNSGPLDGWETAAADSFAGARFVQQHNPCDILLVDETLYRREGSEGLDWLSRQDEVPVVVLTGSPSQTAPRAHEPGVHIWLPRELTLAHPELLAVALSRAAQLGDVQQANGRLRESLQQSRRQVDRLVSLLWRTLPMDPDRHWLSQRHMLERLREEIARSERHGTQLTVALGEVASPGGEGTADAALADWTTDRITRGKRRCDVAGQYGLQGFMLLMVNTPAQGGVTCCRRLQKSLEQGSSEGPRGPVRAAFGLASFSADTATPQSLLRCAEEHLETARAGANDRVATAGAGPCIVPDAQGSPFAAQASC